MEIKLKHGHEIIERKINGAFFEISPELENVYQNSSEIADIKMEISSYKLYGCRAISIFRSINHKLLNDGIIKENIKMTEFDKIADNGGELSDAWRDASTPIFDILDSVEIINRVNKIYNCDLKYELIKKSDYNRQTKKDLYEFLIANNSMIIKMPHLIASGSNHFVNVDGVILDHETGDVYFRMKESYAGYDGYDKYFVKWDFPEYYEIIF